MYYCAMPFPLGVLGGAGSRKRDMGDGLGEGLEGEGQGLERRAMEGRLLGEMWTR